MGDMKKEVKDEKGQKRGRVRRIRESKHVSGFMRFIKGQGVVGLAIGLVIGTAAATLVNSLINNVVMPPLGFLLGSSDGLKGLVIDMGVTAGGEEAVLRYGVFLSDLINFLVIALVIYIVVKLLHLEPPVKK